MLRAVRQFVTLQSSDRRLFVHSFVALGKIDGALRLGSLDRVVERQGRLATQAGRAVTVEDLHRARRYAYWIDVAARHHFVRARCLHRSLALHCWLIREGLPSTLRIGVLKENGDLKAHAWVELQGEVVNDLPSAIAMFTPLAGKRNDFPASGPQATVPFRVRQTAIAKD